MPRGELGPLLAAHLYLAALVALSEAARRRARVSADVTRKCFHMAVGTWSIPAIFLFEDFAWAVVPFLSLTALNYLSFRFELFAGIEDDGPSLGSVFFPLSCALLLGLYWDRAHVALGGIMAATWGDTIAGLTGRRLGTRKYRTFAGARTMEGTLGMFLASSAAIAPVLALVGRLDWHQAVAFSLIGASVAAAVEAAAPGGLDNLAVPLATAVTLDGLVRLSV